MLFTSDCDKDELGCSSAAEMTSTPDAVAMATSAGTRRRRHSTEDPQLVLESPNLLLSVSDLLLQRLNLVQLPEIFLQQLCSQTHTHTHTHTHTPVSYTHLTLPTNREV